MNRRPGGSPSVVKRLRRLLICSLTIAGAAAAVRAELVVFSDGRVVKATSHQVAGDQLEISLPGGGSYSVDRSRVERVVDDEVATPDLPASRPVEKAPTARAENRRADTTTPIFVQNPDPQQAPEERRPKSKDEKGPRGSKVKHGKTGR